MNPHQKTRRRALAALSLGGLSLLLPGCAPRPPLRISSQVWPGYEFLYLARELGFLPESQVMLLDIPASGESLHALEYGFVDGAALTLDEVLRARANGMPLVIVAVLDISAGADMLLARPPITMLAQLRGKRIGVEHSGAGALMLNRALAAAGLTPEDVTIVKLAPPEQEAAWKQQRIDAVVTYAPVAGRLMAAGARRLFDSRQMPDTIVDVLCLHAKALQAQGTEVRTLIQAHFRALGRWQRQPELHAPLLARRLGASIEALPGQFAEIRLPDVAENHRLIGGSAPALAPHIEELASLMQREGLIGTPDAAARLPQLLRADFLPTA